MVASSNSSIAESFQRLEELYQLWKAAHERTSTNAPQATAIISSPGSSIGVVYTFAGARFTDVENKYIHLRFTGAIGSPEEEGRSTWPDDAQRLAEQEEFMIEEYQDKILHLQNTEEIQKLQPSTIRILEKVLPTGRYDNDTVNAILALNEYYDLGTAYPGTNSYISSGVFTEPLKEKIDATIQPRRIVARLPDPPPASETIMPYFDDEQIDSFELVTFNSILPDAILQDKKRILSPTFQVETAEENFIPLEKAQSFRNYYEEKMFTIQLLFKYLDEKLKSDKDLGLQLDVQGNDFLRDLRKLESVPDELGALLALPVVEEKYQLTMVVDTSQWTPMPVAFMFYYYDEVPESPDDEFPSQRDIMKGVIKSTYISADVFNAVSDSVFKEVLGNNTIRYLYKIDELYDAAKSGFSQSRSLKAENDRWKGFFGKEEYSDCLSPDAWYADLPNGLNTLISHSYKDYIKFSNEFQRPSISKKDNTEMENNKARVNQNTENVSAFDKVVKGTINAAESSAIELVSSEYVVQAVDRMEGYPTSAAQEGDDEYFAKNGAIVDGTVLGPEERSEVSSEEYESILEGKINTLFKLSSKRNFDAHQLVRLNKPLTTTFKQNSKKPDDFGNALRPGMVIKIPREGASLGSMMDFGKGMFEGVTDQDWGKIWKESLLDPFISKICPNTLPQRILDCLLPTNCGDLIKYIGLWRTRDMMEEFVNLDVFDDRNGLMAALDDWDSQVSENYSFKAVSFNGNGLLKSGEFDKEALYAEDPTSISVSLQVRTTTSASGDKIPDQRAINDGRTKYIFQQKGMFAIKKTSEGNISVLLESADGKKAEYSSSGAADIFDGNFHQIGFSWVGSIGELVLIIDGREVNTLLIDGEHFRGALGEKQQTEIVVASASPTRTEKGFAGQIDEIVIFNQILTPDDWEKLGTIDSDINLNTMGLAQRAQAWWRMGDSTKDRLTTPGSDPGDDEIIDRLSSINLTPLAKNGDQIIVVTRLFKTKDEDHFISIITRNVDIIALCNLIIEFVNQITSVGIDPEKIIEDIENMFRLPKTVPDPHLQATIFIQDTIVVTLIQTISKFLIDMLEEYIVNCQNWKSLLQALTKGTLAASGGSNVGAAWSQAFGDAMDTNPLLRLLSGNAGDAMLSELFDHALQYSEVVKSSVGVRYGATGQGSAAPVTLNLGDVSFADAPSPGSEVYTNWPATQDNFDIAIRDTSNSVLDRKTTIEIIKKTAQSLPADETLRLFSGTATTSTLDAVNQIVRQNFSDVTANTATDALPVIFGSFGDAIGASSAIDQLTHMAQLLANTLPNIMDGPCPPGGGFRDKLKLPRNPLEDQRARDMVGKILDAAEDGASPNACPPPIPLSQFERAALSRTISAVFAPVLAAYDSSLTMFRCGLLDTEEKTERIKKVLWKGEPLTRDVWDEDRGIVEKTIEIKKTIINPEFKTLIDQGYIPLKSDGSPDGTEFGGVVKTEWWPFGGNFLGEKKPPVSLVASPPENEDDEVKQPDIDIGDLHKSLGPYTDYKNPYADVGRPVLKVGGNAAKALSRDQVNFSLKDTGELTKYVSPRKPNSSVRGYQNIVSKSKTNLLATIDIRGVGSLVKDSYSNVSYTIGFGTALSGKKFLDFKKDGADEFSFNAEVGFNLSQNLQQKILETGYNPLPEACEDASEDGIPNELPDNLKYTPQENVFSFVAKKNTPDLALTDDALGIYAFDELYKESLTAILLKVSGSPLLKSVPNTDDGSGNELTGLSFVNFDTTPRLIDMASLSKQVAEDYSSLLACPDQLEEPALTTALKTSVPRILARIYLADIVLKGIIPFSQLSLSKDNPVVQEFIIRNMERDFQTFLKGQQQDGVKAKIVQQFNKLAYTGNIDLPSIDEDNFRTEWVVAMKYFIQDEFGFITSRIKEMIHGECIDNENPSSSQGTDMYETILNYAKVESQNLNLRKYMILENGDRVSDYFIGDEPIERVGISLTFSYNDQEIILCSHEEEFTSLSEELSLGDTEHCDDRALYPSVGNTTKSDGHYHEYNVDKYGKGQTTKIHGNAMPHTHGVLDYAVIPYTNKAGAVKHSHELAKNTSTSKQQEGTVKFKIEDSMEKKIMASADFKIMFDYCFNLSDASSLVLTYCLLTAENQIMNRVFSGTKKAILDMFVWLWVDGSSADPCSSDIATRKAPDFSQLIPDLGSFLDNPQALLMYILAPLLTFRGWSKTADPHVLITTSIMDVLNMPLIPRMEWKNAPNPANDFELECMQVPVWPGTRVLDEMTLGSYWTLNGITVEAAVAGLVTVAPMPFTGSPFPPTPFGMWYYALVMPLIWFMRDLPRLLEMAKQDDDTLAMLMSLGLNLQPISCDVLDDPTGSGQGANEEAPKCPEIRNFNDTIMDVSTSEC